MEGSFSLDGKEKPEGVWDFDHSASHSCRGRTRLPEIDAARGLAVLLMVVYHIGFDLNLYGLASFPVQGGWYDGFGNAIAALFLLVVGISLWVSHGWAIERYGAARAFQRRLRRAGWIAGGAGGISLFSWWFDPERVIFFGILHLIAISILLASPLVRRPILAGLVGGGILVAGVPLAEWRVPFPGLAWLGIRPFGLSTLDYYPLVPWFGWVCLGVAVGACLYPGLTRRSLSASKAPLWLVGVGRRSLIIYLLHQPILLGVMAFSAGRIAP
jgi:uncharacterized membrane protein